MTIIDFIGIYKNNYPIPIALTGDKSHSKDGTRDAIARELIMELQEQLFSFVIVELNNGLRKN